MKKLYYVVEKELASDGELEYATGNKMITIYKWDDVLGWVIQFANIDCLNEDNTEKEIEKCVIDMGYSFDGVQLIQL